MFCLPRYLYVKFVTDGDTQYSGFKAAYTADAGRVRPIEIIVCPS